MVGKSVSEPPTNPICIYAMNIDIDIGNSRAKWRLSKKDQIVDKGHFASGIDDLVSFFRRVEAQHGNLLTTSKVRIACVKDANWTSQPSRDSSKRIPGRAIDGSKRK